MSFKEIIYHYRQQPQARSEVFRNVTIVQVSSSPKHLRRATAHPAFECCRHAGVQFQTHLPRPTQATMPLIVVLCCVGIRAVVGCTPQTCPEPAACFRAASHTASTTVIRQHRQSCPVGPASETCTCFPQTDPQLTVQKTGDVIEYYNATFIPVAKALLMRVGAGKQALKSPPGAEHTTLTSTLALSLIVASRNVETPHAHARPHVELHESRIPHMRTRSNEMKVAGDRRSFSMYMLVPTSK